jgi:hypothetical protein
MEDFRNMNLIVEMQEREWARLKRNACLEREWTGAPQRSGWLMRLAALTIILVGLAAVWVR